MELLWYATLTPAIRVWNYRYALRTVPLYVSGTPSVPRWTSSDTLDSIRHMNFLHTSLTIPINVSGSAITCPEISRHMPLEIQPFVTGAPIVRFCVSQHAFLELQQDVCRLPTRYWNSFQKSVELPNYVIEAHPTCPWGSHCVWPKSSKTFHTAAICQWSFRYRFLELLPYFPVRNTIPLKLSACVCGSSAILLLLLLCCCFLFVF